jgi:hypothetical protein
MHKYVQKTATPCKYQCLVTLSLFKIFLGLAGCQFNVVCEEPILNFWTTISADQCKNQCRNTDQVETLFLTKKKFKQPLFIQGKINLSLPRS